MKRLAAILLLTIAPAPAWACSGTALLGASADHAEPVKKGQKLTLLDHIDRDPKSGQVLVCRRGYFFPGIGADDDGRPVEIVRIDPTCTVAKVHTQEDGLDRYELVDPTKPDPDQTETAKARHASRGESFEVGLREPRCPMRR